MSRFSVLFSTVETYSCYVEVEAASAEEAEKTVDHWDADRIDLDTYRKDIETTERYFDEVEQL
jgi:hypothetical protein